MFFIFFFYFFILFAGFFFFSSRRRHTRWNCDWSSDVCSSDLHLAGAGPDAVQHSLGPVGVHAVAVDDRRAARAVAVTVGVLVIGGVVEFPQFGAGLGVPGAQTDAVADAVEDEEAAAADGHRRVAVEDALFPDDAWAVLGPGAEEALFRRHGVARRAEEGGPVDAGLARPQVRRRFFRRDGRRHSGEQEQRDRSY